jgi:hypothetical protein
MQKNMIIVFLFLSLIITGTAWAGAASYDSTNFNADSRKWQPAPAGHIPGRDSGTGVGTHNSGEDCGLCHTPGGKAGNYVFTIGGTIYEDRAARRPLRNAEVILQDFSGKILSMTTNETGNFWTTANLASNPCTVASHSGTTHQLYTLDGAGNCVPSIPASDSRSWQYKAWVKHGDQVRHMVSIVPVGGATGTSPRMSCNMHHSPMGSSGGVWGMRKNTLAAYPLSNLSFKKHILPIFRNKCAPCHIPGNTKTRLVTRTDIDPATPTSIDYSSARDYTSYAGSIVTTATATFTKPGIQALATGYQAAPDSSPLLAKTLMQSDNAIVIHAGGGFWTPADGDYRAIRQWIVEGALNN